MSTTIFNPKMLEGLTLFAQGLYKSVLERSKEKNISLTKAMENEIEEMNVFLEALNQNYSNLRKDFSAANAMKKLAEINFKDKNVKNIT